MVIVPRHAIRTLLIGTTTGGREEGATRMVEITKREGFYQQKYCGCAHSLREAKRQGCPRTSI